MAGPGLNGVRHHLTRSTLRFFIPRRNVSVEFRIEFLQLPPSPSTSASTSLITVWGWLVVREKLYALFDFANLEELGTILATRLVTVSLYH